MNKQPPTEEKMIELLGHFQPKPSAAFQQRMAQAPWRQAAAPRTTWPLRMASAAIGLVLLAFIFQPQLTPLLQINNTPTATYTATVTPTEGVSATDLTATEYALTATANLLTPAPDFSNTPLP